MIVIKSLTIIFLQDIANKMITELKKNQSQLKNNPQVINQYDRDQIKFRPFRLAVANQNEVTVESIIICQNGQQVLISHNLIKTGANGKSMISALMEVSLV